MNDALRAQFPILAQQVRGQDLVYLDNAATVHNPTCVLDASRRYYEAYNSNIHRGTHHLSQVATAAHEKARESVAQHLNASRPEEIIFTSGCTDSINLVAIMLGQGTTGMNSGGLSIQEGDEILLSSLEHHSNIVPWQMLAQQTGAILKIIPLTANQSALDLNAYEELLSEKTKLIAVNHISNALGILNPIEQIISLAREKSEALILIDGAQSVPHLKVDLQTLDADFYTFSGHKAYAPTGIGILYGKHDLLETLPPARGGGEMIKEVQFFSSTYNDPPFKYEAGTPNIEGAIALAAALDFLNDLGLEEVARHENQLLTQAAEGLSSIEGIKLYGSQENSQRHGALSFNIDGIHHYDLGTLLDQMGIAVRTGHHCCQPLMGLLGTTGTVRASVAAYNTSQEIDAFITATQKAASMLR